MLGNVWQIYIINVLSLGRFNDIKIKLNDEKDAIDSKCCNWLMSRYPRSYDSLISLALVG